MHAEPAEVKYELLIDELSVNNWEEGNNLC